MKKQISILSSIIIVTTVLLSCDSSPVAHYKYGTITKGQLKERAKDTKLTPQLTRSLIESLCVEGIALHEAGQNKYADNESFQLRLERQIQPIIARVVNDKSRAAMGLSWDYVKCRHILFRTKDTSTESKIAAREKAEEVIALINKGVAFDSLIKSYSSDPKKAVDDSIVYVVKNGGMPQFEQAAFLLEKGTWSAEPVLLPDGSAIVLVADERGKLTLDDLPKKVKSPFEQKRLTDIFKASTQGTFIAYLEQSNNGALKVDKLPKDDSTILFSVAGKDYSMKDLNHRRDLLSGIVLEPIKNPAFLASFVNEWYMSLLYRMEAERKGYLKEKDLAAELKRATDFILANDYIRFVCENEIVVSEKEMLEEYNKNKNHYMKLPPSPRQKPIQLSFSEAKVFVRKNLIQSRVAGKVAEWKVKALAESGLKME